MIPVGQATVVAEATIGSIDVFLLLRSIQGWDAEKYAEWLSRTLVDQLLVSEH